MICIILLSRRKKSFLHLVNIDFFYKYIEIYMIRYAKQIFEPMCRQKESKRTVQPLFYELLKTKIKLSGTAKHPPFNTIVSVNIFIRNYT